MFWLIVNLLLALGCSILVGSIIWSANLETVRTTGNKVPKPRAGLKASIGATVAALVVLLVLTAWQAIVIIDAGHVGVVTRLGAITGRNMEPGFNTKTPYIEDVTIFDVRVQKEQIGAAAASKDLQEVKATIAVNYRLDAMQAANVFQTIGSNYKERVVDPAIQEAFKASTALYTAEELITQREVVKLRALDVLQEKLIKFHVVIDELNIVNFDFSDSFNTAVEAKQVAQQNVEKAKRDLERNKIEAQQRIAEAEGQAKAQQLQQQTLTDRYLQLLAVQKWNGELPKVMAGEGMPFILGSIEGLEK